LEGVGHCQQLALIMPGGVWIGVRRLMERHPTRSDSIPRNLSV